MSENSKAFEEYDDDLSRTYSNLSFLQRDPPYNLRQNFLSEPMIIIDKPNVRQICSDQNFGYEVNYDDLCGPWSCPKIPAYQNYDIPSIPKICSWIFIEEADMIYMRKFQNNKEAILTLIDKKLPNNGMFDGVNKDIFLQLMWEVFRFARDNGYTDISTSSLLGLFYITHCYFLASSKRTAAETYKFFEEGVLLHTVLHPPKSAEIFTPTESKQLLNLFCNLYMRQLPLLRLVCLPNYRLLLTIDRSSLQPGA